MLKEIPWKPINLIWYVFYYFIIIDVSLLFQKLPICICSLCVWGLEKWKSYWLCFVQDIGAKDPDFGFLSGQFHVDLIIGDAIISKPFVWHVADLRLFSHGSETKEAPVSSHAHLYKPKPEIKVWMILCVLCFEISFHVLLLYLYLIFKPLFKIKLVVAHVPRAREEATSCCLQPVHNSRAYASSNTSCTGAYFL